VRCVGIVTTVRCGRVITSEGVVRGMRVMIIVRCVGVVVVVVDVVVIMVVVVTSVRCVGVVVVVVDVVVIMVVVVTSARSMGVITSARFVDFVGAVGPIRCIRGLSTVGVTRRILLLSFRCALPLNALANLRLRLLSFSSMGIRIPSPSTISGFSSSSFCSCCSFLLLCLFSSTFFCLKFLQLFLSLLFFSLTL
jgi:hypothetical protein